MLYQYTEREKERETYSIEDIAKLTFAKEEVLVCIYSNLWPDQFWIFSFLFWPGVSSPNIMAHGNWPVTFPDPSWLWCMQSQRKKKLLFKTIIAPNCFLFLCQPNYHNFLITGLIIRCDDGARCLCSKRNFPQRWYLELNFPTFLFSCCCCCSYSDRGVQCLFGDLAPLTRPKRTDRQPEQTDRQLYQQNLSH